MKRAAPIGERSIMGAGLSIRHGLLRILYDNVVGSAFDDGGGADQGQACLFLKLGDREGTAVAHRGLNLVKRAAHAVLEGTGVGNVGVNALDEAELRGAASRSAASCGHAQSPRPSTPSCTGR